MLNWVKRHPYLAATIAAIIFLALAFVVSPFIGFVGEICSKSEHSDAKEGARYYLAPYTILWIAQVIDAHNGFVSALAAVAVAWFTATLYWASVEQGKLTEKSIKFGRDEFKTTQRAFVYLDSLVAHFSLLYDNPSSLQYERKSKLDADLIVTGLWIQPIWRNSGSTPTKNMRIQVWFGNGEHWSPGQYQNPTPTPFFLGPQATSGSKLIDVHSGFINELIEWKNNPVGTIPPPMIWGRADYEDVFGESHFTEWCYSPEATRTDPTERLRISFVQADQHNRSDYNQPK